MAVPPYHEMFNPALLALRELGGSCSIAEMSDRVAKIADLSEEDVSATHKGNMTLLEYRLAWTRIYFSAAVHRVGHGLDGQRLQGGDANGNLVSMTIEHARKNANLPEVAYEAMARTA